MGIDEEGEPSGSESSERWLISYADFITLLFALFVVLYAVSSQSKLQARKVYGAMATAVGMRPNTGGLRPSLVGGGSDPALEQLEMRRLSQLAGQISHDVAQFKDSGVTVKIDKRGLVISLAAAKFFASGEAAISARQTPVLSAILARIEKLPNRIRVEGFTDSVPIHNQDFVDNWALSAARAGNVLRYFVDHSNISPARLSLAGYGPYRPVANNDTAEGRALNRRVDLVIPPLTDRDSANALGNANSPG